MEREVVRIPTRAGLICAGAVAVAGLICVVLAVPSWWRGDPCDAPGISSCFGDYPVDERLLWVGVIVVFLAGYAATVVGVDAWLRRRRTVLP